ncbi:adenylate/guanylate cyclase domain-containing protein [Gordonia sp. VNK21]|uniref:adenylate/guanylate cyclase domain-containing protein n=1 Tax=Gordonia sp. VNK21 TaxID=3382483 RepID=UPI0038D4ACFE
MVEREWARGLLHRLADQADRLSFAQLIGGPLGTGEARGAGGYLAEDWRALDMDRRRRIANRAIAVSLVVGLGARVLITIETFLLVLLAFNGGRLSVHTAVDHPSFWDMFWAVLIGGLVTLIAAGLQLKPQTDWFISGEVADAERRRAVRNIPLKQAYSDVLGWVVSIGIYALVADVSLPFLAAVGGAFSLAAVTSACLTYLFVESVVRPMAVMALSGNSESRVVHGVRERMIVVWSVSTAVPMLGLIVINFGRWMDWVAPVAGRVDWASIFLAGVALLSGLRVITLVGRSIADPLTEMREVIQSAAGGDFTSRVAVYDSSELGILQSGLNGMLDGLQERERMREIFSRHVGDTVARLALEQQGEMTGANADAAVLFVDITGSTAFAENRDPRETAVVLNAFFSLAAEVVERHNGLINKFEGDAALVVFGAPTVLDDPAGAALAAARELGEVLAEKLPLSWGIGVSYGRVFAGNIGAQTRHEYTVIGDPVNECARLCDRAKDGASPICAGGRAVAAAAETEAQHWRSSERVTLRGRAEVTEIFVPRGMASHAVPPTLGSVLAELVKLPYQTLVRGGTSAREPRHAAPARQTGAARPPVDDGAPPA